MAASFQRSKIKEQGSKKVQVKNIKSLKFEFWFLSFVVEGACL